MPWGKAEYVYLIYEQARHALLSLGKEGGEGGNARRCCRYTTRISGKRREGGGGGLPPPPLYWSHLGLRSRLLLSRTHTQKKREGEQPLLLFWAGGPRGAKKSQLSLEYVCLMLINREGDPSFTCLSRGGDDIRGRNRVGDSTKPSSKIRIWEFSLSAAFFCLLFSHYQMISW